MEKLVERIVEVARVGPEDRLVIHLREDPDDELLDGLIKALEHIGLKGRALVLYGDMELKVIQP